MYVNIKPYIKYFCDACLAIMRAWQYNISNNNIKHLSAKVVAAKNAALIQAHPPKYI